MDSLVLQKVQFDRQPSEIWVIEIKGLRGILGNRIFSSFSLLKFCGLIIGNEDSFSWIVFTIDFRCFVPSSSALEFSFLIFFESVSGMQPVIIVS